MYCKNCGKNIEFGEATCSYCGQNVGMGNRFCAQCGTFVIPGDKVCSECGAQLISNYTSQQQTNNQTNRNNEKEYMEPPEAPKFDPTGKKYCRNCGLMIDRNAVQCEFCNSPVNSSANYCNFCGKGTTSMDKNCIFCGAALTQSSNTYRVSQQKTPTTPPNFDITDNTQIQSPKSGGKSLIVTFLLCIFTGYLGIHRFYTGHYTIGIVQLLTGGGCGIWYIIDLIMIVAGSYKSADGKPLERDI